MTGFNSDLDITSDDISSEITTDSIVNPPSADFPDSTELRPDIDGKYYINWQAPNKTPQLYRVIYTKINGVRNQQEV